MENEEEKILDECLKELDKFRAEKQGKQEPTDWGNKSMRGDSCREGRLYR